MQRNPPDKGPDGHKDDRNEQSACGGKRDYENGGTHFRKESLRVFLYRSGRRPHPPPERGKRAGMLYRQAGLSV